MRNAIETLRYLADAKEKGALPLGDDLDLMIPARSEREPVSAL